jgi:hypothetical protein
LKRYKKVKQQTKGKGKVQLDDGWETDTRLMDLLHTLMIGVIERERLTSFFITPKFGGN